MGSLQDHGEERLGLLDAEELRKQARLVADFIADYYKAIESYPVCSQVQPGYLSSRLPETAPNKPAPLEAILQDVKKHILPGLTHWQSPSFFAYFQANVSTGGFLGEMLCSGFNVVGFNWLASPAATELESLVMDWMGGMLNLPSSFRFNASNNGDSKNGDGGGGVILGSTCEAVVCTLVAARDKVLSSMGYDSITKLVVYGSDQTHSCLQKACKIAGINPNHYRPLATSYKTGFALLPDVARRAMASDVAAGLIPLFLCATVGTTGVGAVDPLHGLAQVAKEYKAWLHVDAAYAGSACICPEFRSYLDGVEHADSMSTNPHKWLLTNMDCCCLWVKHTSLLVNALSTSAVFLDNPGTASLEVIDYKDWQIALSRRFRAIKLWLVIRSYGLNGLREHVRRHVRLAMLFEKWVSTDERFEIVAPRRLALVCFRLKPGGGGDGEGSELNRKLLEAINSTGKVYMTHTVVDKMFVLRFAVGSTLTEERHVRGAWSIIQEQSSVVAAGDAASIA
ncbi:tyrosine decarboxylase 1-like isoform X2 [Nymphaea colorata]|uniref:Tyrosine decarboxylase n=2 Tax=Nymphaea colorata TaxID=210225 RepID=A0A5K0W3N9_9MAGN|nr:tyrosine decarboxylase 1-like isoform X2 [Nymphaea colorata]